MILAAMMAVVCFAGASAQVARGEKSLGVKAGYVSHNESAVAGLVFRYAVSPWVRIVPEIGCVFRHHNQDAFLIDINAQVPFTFGTDRVDLYPLAGLTFNSWSSHGKMVVEEFNTPGTGVHTPESSDGMEIKDVTTRANRFGANLGAGFDLKCSRSLTVGLEARYTFVKRFTSLYLTASIAYIF